MTPLEVFKEFVRRKVKVHTSDRGVYTGILEGFDAFVNIKLTDAQFEDPGGAEKLSMAECLINGQRVTFVEVL